MKEDNKIALEHVKILRGPTQVAVDITNKCNFRCLHCYNLSGENSIIDEELSDNEFIELINDIAQMKVYNVCFCGGEPLLRKELIYQCAEILRKNNVPNVSLVTNGFLLSEEVAKNLYEAGVNRVQISLDGADAKTHEKLRKMKGAYEKAIQAINNLRKIGFKDIDVAFCPTKFNINQIKDIHNLCLKLGVSQLRIQPLMYLGRATRNLDIVPSQLQYRDLVREIYDIQNSGKPPQIEWGDPVDHLIRFRTLSKHCINFVSIKANGSIIVSPYLPLTVGNIRKHRFGEYWEAGLARIWELDIVNELASKITSISDFNKKYSDIPIVWEEKDIEIDIIDNYRIENHSLG